MTSTPNRTIAEIEKILQTRKPVVYLTRRASFCASHRLHVESLSASDNQRIFGKCNNPNGHGHNYVIEVTLRAPIDPHTGMTINLTELKAILNEAIVDELDHHHLNLDVPLFRHINPTAENMVVVFWHLLVDRLPDGTLYEVRLQETENNASIYRGETGA